MKTKGQLTITRPSYGCGKQKIAIRIKDTDAVTRFLDIEIDLDKFTKCITGLAEIECDIEYRNLDHVGKKRETMSLEFEMPGKSRHNRKEIAFALGKKCAPEGWTCSNYFSSQDSFFSVGDKDYAKTHATRWVKK